MLARFRNDPLVGNVLALIGLCVAVGVGTAYAAGLGPNSVKSKHIANGQVKEKDLSQSSVTYAKLACKGNGRADKMVRAGAVCIDRYEASVWSKPKGGIQYGVSSDDYPCDNNGQNCENIYARSVPGVEPSGYITWFQAQRALANSGKRLPTNAEWQQAVAGTPDSTDCNVDTGATADTGASANCVSDFGAFDMVGNVSEWVADWDEQAGGCGEWEDEGFGSDRSCVGESEPDDPELRAAGAAFRGGAATYGTVAGPFMIDVGFRPTGSAGNIGFRGVR